jgi:hypothetical protein
MIKINKEFNELNMQRAVFKGVFQATGKNPAFLK